MPRPANFDYQRYLASREWALKREAVRDRSGNRCEHCLIGPQEAVHHRTYARLGHEEIDDLLAICNDCHAFVSGKANENPLNLWAVVSKPLEDSFGNFAHLCIPLSAEWNHRLVRCEEESCRWCEYAHENWRFWWAKWNFWRWRT